jgi:hypothetical protein
LSFRKLVKFAWTTTAVCLLTLAVGVTVIWIMSPWRWLEIGLITEHDLSEAMTGSATDEKGSIVRTRTVSFASGMMYVEVDEVFRIFEKNPPVRRMLPGDWNVRVLSAASGDDAGRGEILKDTLTAGQAGPDYYLRGNDVLGEVAIWKLVLALFPLPIIWLGLLVRRRMLRFRRLAHGLCLSCGYDLRSSSERCPECGQPRPLAYPTHRR